MASVPRSCGLCAQRSAERPELLRNAAQVWESLDPARPWMADPQVSALFRSTANCLPAARARLSETQSAVLRWAEVPRHAAADGRDGLKMPCHAPIEEKTPQSVPGVRSVHTFT